MYLSLLVYTFFLFVGRLGLDCVSYSFKRNIHQQQGSITCSRKSSKTTRLDYCTQSLVENEQGIAKDIEGPLNFIALFSFLSRQLPSSTLVVLYYAQGIIYLHHFQAFWQILSTFRQRVRKVSSSAHIFAGDFLKLKLSNFKRCLSII